MLNLIVYQINETETIIRNPKIKEKKYDNTSVDQDAT